jgi:hypothetical protein
MVLSDSVYASQGGVRVGRGGQSDPKVCVMCAMCAMCVMCVMCAMCVMCVMCINPLLLYKIVQPPSTQCLLTPFNTIICL